MSHAHVRYNYQSHRKIILTSLAANLAVTAIIHYAKSQCMIPGFESEVDLAIIHVRRLTSSVYQADLTLEKGVDIVKNNIRVLIHLSTLSNDIILNAQSTYRLIFSKLSGKMRSERFY